MGRTKNRKRRRLGALSKQTEHRYGKRRSREWYGNNYEFCYLRFWWFYDHIVFFHQHKLKRVNRRIDWKRQAEILRHNEIYNNIYVRDHFGKFFGVK